MRKALILTCTVAILGAGAVAFVATRSTASLSAQLDTTLKDFHTRYHFPGATAAITLPNGTVLTAATGLADIEHARSMTTETPMLAASIGKTFVAATVLALESDGYLSRADLLSDHLSDRPWFEDLPNAQKITIQQLLQHSSGLPDHVHLQAFQSAWPELATNDATVSPERLIGFVKGMDPLFEAGKGWAYSDTGYILLGMLIQAVTGETWSEVVRARFIDPLNLSRTSLANRPDLPGLAVGYVAPDNPFGLPIRTADKAGRLLWNPAIEGAGGGFASTSQDLALWGHLLFGGDAMKKSYLVRMLESVPVSADTHGIRYGAGVAIYAETPRGPVYGHGGWIPGYVSSLRHYDDYGVTVVFQINTDAELLDGSSDLVPTLEAALADLALDALR